MHEQRLPFSLRLGRWAFWLAPRRSVAIAAVLLLCVSVRAHTAELELADGEKSCQVKCRIGYGGCSKLCPGQQADGSVDPEHKDAYQSCVAACFEQFDSCRIGCE